VVMYGAVTFGVCKVCRAGRGTLSEEGSAIGFDAFCEVRSRRKPMQQRHSQEVARRIVRITQRQLLLTRFLWFSLTDPGLAQQRSKPCCLRHLAGKPVVTV
jgi:hypothetical protein